MNVTVRAARSEDAAVIAEFNARLAAETESKTLDRDVLLRGVIALIADSQKGRYFLAHQGADILGQVAISYEWSDWRNGWFWWLQSVYVRPDARGRGIFTKLYNAVRDEAQNEGVIGLRLYVDQANDAGQSTYLRLGLTPTTYQVYEQMLHSAFSENKELRLGGN